MSENVDPVQQQELEFFAMMLPGTKHQAPAPSDAEGTAPKHNKPNEKGGQGRGGVKGRDYKDSRQDRGSGDQRWDTWDWNKKDGHGGDGKRLAALEQQVNLLTRLTLRHEDAVNLTRSEVSFVVHAKLGIDAGVVPQLFRVQTVWRELKKNSPEKLDKSMRSTLVLCLFREVLNRVEKLPQDPAAFKEFTDNTWLSADGRFWPFLSYHSESKLLLPDKDNPGLHTDTLTRHLKAVIKYCVEDHALGRFHPIRPMGEAMTKNNLVFLLQTGAALCSSADAR